MVVQLLTTDAFCPRKRIYYKRQSRDCTIKYRSRLNIIIFVFDAQIYTSDCKNPVKLSIFTIFTESKFGFCFAIIPLITKHMQFLPAVYFNSIYV